MDNITTIANNQSPKATPRYYQLVNNGVVLAEHDSPSWLNWYKNKHALTGVIKGVYR